MTNSFENISVIGCGRWGGFLAYYTAKYCAKTVTLHGLEQAPDYQELIKTRKNDYLSLPDNISLTCDMSETLKNEFVIISIGCQNFRMLCKELNKYDLKGKKFLLAMKGLEVATGKRMTEVFAEEISQDASVAVLLGPGHVQDYLKEIPSCAVIDSADEKVKKEIVDFMTSDLIRVYYGTDLVGNEIGGALKNVVGLAAGILDGLNWHGLKGALMARAPIEVGRLIEKFGGKSQTAYGLSHLGDYEATLFSPHSHNRKYGEDFAKGIKFEKLAEGVATLKAVQEHKGEVDMPICDMLFEVMYNEKCAIEQIGELFKRPTKNEF